LSIFYLFNLLLKCKHLNFDKFNHIGQQTSADDFGRWENSGKFSFRNLFQYMRLFFISNSCCIHLSKLIFFPQKLRLSLILSLACWSKNWNKKIYLVLCHHMDGMESTISCFRYWWWTDCKQIWLKLRLQFTILSLYINQCMNYTPPITLTESYTHQISHKMQHHIKLLFSRHS
jgi:hypothetical protein